MCGIAGLLVPPGKLDGDELSRLAARMAATVRHRGPDGDGCWSDPAAGIGLAHRRLAVVDLSARGRQPMTAVGGRQVLIYNGEVYNYLALRRELISAGQCFVGDCDAEVLAALIARFGLAAALQRVNGAFALALWDPDTRILWLARDRLGEKPLYYGWCGGAFLFGSELKALRAYPGFTAPVDRDVLALYFALGYVPAPYCIDEGVRKVPAGCVLRLSAPARPGGESIRPYWDLRAIAAGGESLEPAMARLDELDALLRDAVALRCNADVPVGAFLSGGVDSAAVVALMTRYAPAPVATFTVGFHEPAFDEAAQAAAVARLLGAEHHQLVVSARDALGLLPQLPDTYDEPFFDPAALPTLLLSRLARQHVTVAQSGEGSDEIFGGYPPYRAAARAARRAARAGRPAPDALRTHLTRTIWRDGAALVPGARSPDALLRDTLGSVDLGRVPAGLLLADTLTWLPDNCLVKVDRASMAVGLEVRCPYLDHRIVELAYRTPIELKVRANVDKWILRRVVARYLPEWVYARPKQGFNLPLAGWLRGPLRAWAEDLLHPGRLDGLAVPAVRGRWRRHLAGVDDHLYEIWTVLMFQEWRRHRAAISDSPANRDPRATADRVSAIDR